MALVRFMLKLKGKTIRIYVPFYQSTGTNSSRVGVGTWFQFHGSNFMGPISWVQFHCASQKLEQTTREYYFRSGYGTSYLFP